MAARKAPRAHIHLEILVDAGILTRDKRGVCAYYALVPGTVDALAAVLIMARWASGTASRAAAGYAGRPCPRDSPGMRLAVIVWRGAGPGRAVARGG